MATEILRPQDVLVQRFRLHPTSCPRRRNFPAIGVQTSMALNPNQQKRPSAKHEKKRSTTAAAAAETRKLNQGGERRQKGEIGGAALVVGPVTLLRRGESLNSLVAKFDLATLGDPIAEDQASIRARSDSELVVPRKIRRAVPPPMVDIYAGAGFESSPSPRCLPRPTFVNKMGGDANEPFEDGATRSLRRILRLE